MASGVSIGRAWDEAWAFLRRESALLLPVSAATIGPAMLLLLLVMPEPVNDKIPGGPWLLWLLPFYGLSLLGVLATTALALKPGMSVREALGLALRRLPSAAVIVLLLAGISLLASIPVALIGAIEMASRGAVGSATGLANIVVGAAMVWLSVRLLPVWPMVADLAIPPMAAFRRSFALTRGHAGRLLGLMVLAVVAAVVVGSALLFGGGAVLMAIGRAAGGERLASLLVGLLLAAIVTCAATIWSVFVAFLYRQLAAASA